jgi:hypothetical protein
MAHFVKYIKQVDRDTSHRLLTPAVSNVTNLDIRFGQISMVLRRIRFHQINTWILHESEVFIGKASKGDVVVFYFKPLATQHMKASGSPSG